MAKTTTSAASAPCEWLSPRARVTRRPRSRASPAPIALFRRGVHHGFLVPRAEAPMPENEIAARWRVARPIVLRGELRGRLEAHRAAITATLRTFWRLRRGARFFDLVLERLARQTRYRPMGSSIDLADAREVEKVFARARGMPRQAEDVWAKLAWIGEDLSDLSLRIRFSWGVESLQEWHGDARQAIVADGLAEAVFPECAVLAGHAPLRQRLAELAGTPVRLSERIVYNNVPGGGAVFHHDAEQTQLGVCFAQLRGETAWLAVPRRDLVEDLAAIARRRRALRRLRTLARADAALEDTTEPRLDRLLNRDPALTRLLVARGAAFRLRAGDVILLPSHSRAEAAWHSVFGIGRAPSLAHSYGIFPAPPAR